MMQTNRRTRTSMTTGLLALAGAGAMLLAGGCLNYSNYPPEGKTTWINARDTASIREPMAKALKFMIEEDLADQGGLDLPESGPIVAVNVPGGISPESYRWVAQNAHPRATPLSEQSLEDGLPIYHISAVRVRGLEVRVDALRPITGLEQNVEDPAYAGLEVWMEGATGTREIERTRRREIGTLREPELYTIESIEEAFTAQTEPKSVDDAEAATDDAAAEAED